MSEMVSRWPVLVTLPLRSDDLDDERHLTVAAAERLAGEVRVTYLERCRTLDGIALEVLPSTVEVGVPVLGREVTVSAAVTELFPDSFVVATRIRPAEGSGIAAALTTTVGAPVELGREVRDELIAHAHGAAHYH